MEGEATYPHGAWQVLEQCRHRRRKMDTPRKLLRRMFDAAINAAQPAHCIAPHLPAPPRGRMLVIGAGKASAAMAKAMEDSWPGELSGLVVTRYGYGVPCRRIDIVSGPTVPDPTTCADALAIIKRYGIDAPRQVLEVLESGRGETVKPNDPRIAGIDTRMIATPQMALEAAAAIARQAGIPTAILGDSIEGEARDVAKVMAGIALQVARHGQPLAAPCVLR